MAALVECPRPRRSSEAIRVDDQIGDETNVIYRLAKENAVTLTLPRQLLCHGGTALEGERFFSRHRRQDAGQETDLSVVRAGGVHISSGTAMRCFGSSLPPLARTLLPRPRPSERVHRERATS